MEEVKYLRKRDDKFVYKATKMLLQRNDMFPCDKNGRFINTGTDVLPEKEAGPKGPAENQALSELEELRQRARELKVAGWNNAKKETLIKKINEAEVRLELEKGNE
jgi:hypothetical protein